MSHWNHRVLRETLPNGEYYYSIHEVFYNDDGSIYAYTKDPIDVGGESIKDIRQTLNWIRKCLKNPVLIAEDVVFVNKEESEE